MPFCVKATELTPKEVSLLDKEEEEEEEEVNLNMEAGSNALRVLARIPGA